MSFADPQWCPTSVQVTVLQARGLRSKGKSGTNDAYAVMQVGKEKFQTSVVEKSVAPVWKEEATFDLPQSGGGGGGGGGKGTLHVHVLHRALVGPDKALGHAVVDLLCLSEDKTRNKTEWFKLLDKTGKADKDRGEVLLDIQFMRNNMTSSMFDLSAAGKSRSRLGKFKDKVRGKKKESDAGSGVVPSFTQVLTDSEEEANDEEAAAAGKDEKKKKHKMKSLFSSKSNLQRNMSQSMSVLPAKTSSLSRSQSSGLNVDSSEGKKKFKFMIHKRLSSSDGKDSSSGHQKQGGAAEQSNMCINGSHVYCDGSNFSLSSSGHGSMEDVPGSSPPSVNSLKAVTQYSPWTEEEEEETAEVENITEDVDEEQISVEKEKIREEERMRTHEEALEKMAEEKRRQEEEETKRIEEEKEEERARREEEHEQERLADEKRRLQEHERKRIEEEEEERQREERMKKEGARRRLEEERLLAQETRRKEEERRAEEEKARKEEEERIIREEERRREEEEKAVREEEQERARLAEETRRLEEQERKRIEERRREEEHQLAEENRRMEEMRAEEGRVRKEEERRRKEEEEMVRRQEEEEREMKRKLEEQERRWKEEQEKKREEEEKRQEEEERARREKEERERLVREEKERERIEAEEQIKREVEERIKMEDERRRAEQERVKRDEEQEEKKRLEKLERRRIEEEEEEEEKMLREEEERRRREEEDRFKKEKEEFERLAEEKRRVEEQERRQKEEGRRKREEEERLAEEKGRAEEQERRQKEEDRRKREEEEMERLAEEKRRREEQEKHRIEEEEIQREEEQRLRRVEKELEEARKLITDAEEPKNQSKTKHGHESTMAAQVTADVTSTNPFDENFPDNPFEDIPRSPNPPDGNTAKSSVQQGCQIDLSSKIISMDEKNLINAQREKRPAPPPPGRSIAESRREQDVASQHQAQHKKQSNDKDIKTASVLPQRSGQSTPPLSQSRPDAKTARNLTQSSSTKGTESAGKHGKRLAPSRPAEEESSSESKRVSSARGGGTKTNRVPVVCGLNPFEDDEDELAFRDDDDDDDVKRSTQGPSPVAHATDESKLRSSKVTHAPPPPPATSSTLNHPSTDRCRAMDATVVPAPDKGAHRACGPQPEATTLSVQNTSPKEPVRSQSTAEVTPVKKEAPPISSRRLLPVKPLNPLEQKTVSIVQGGKSPKSIGILGDAQEKTKITTDSGLKGPYSQLTREELVSLLQKQENQMSDRDNKISELEQYIDKLIVRVIEEKPSILMSLNSLT